MALKSLSGVTHSVANTAKRAVVIIGSAIAFGEDMGFMKTLGCSVAIGGTFLYAARPLLGCAPLSPASLC